MEKTASLKWYLYSLANKNYIFLFALYIKNSYAQNLPQR